MTWLLVVIALIIGIILGWLLSRRGFASRQQQSDTAWQRKLATAETKTAEAKTAETTAQAAAEKSRQEKVVARGETEVANSKADTARDNLAKAQADSEIVRTEAARARTEADTALADAERAKTEANTARTGAERSRTEAGTAVAEAERARTEADSARTDAERAQTELANKQNAESNVERATPQPPAASLVAPRESPARTDVSDDLTKIEGIGLKIAELLNGGDITTFEHLAAISIERLREIVLGGGSRFRMHDPTTWPEQAALAASGSWEELEALQDVLDGGRRV